VRQKLPLGQAQVKRYAVTLCERFAGFLQFFAELIEREALQKRVAKR